jgi:hypothetical protein
MVTLTGSDDPLQLGTSVLELDFNFLELDSRLPPRNFSLRQIIHAESRGRLPIPSGIVNGLVETHPLSQSKLTVDIGVNRMTDSDDS